MKIYSKRSCQTKTIAVLFTELYFLLFFMRINFS
jgi:hypothetical protein